jgi:hypothetical protein
LRRGAATAAAAALVLVAAPDALGERGPAPLVISPLEEDLESMRGTLARLEELVNARRPDDVADLISPRATAPQRQRMRLVVRALVADLPPEGRYSLRSDIGRGALVPVGPERVALQIRAATTVGEERRRESVRLELAAVERGGRRAWLLTGLEIPRLQSAAALEERAGDHAATGIAVAAVAVLAALVALVVRRRRQARRSPPAAA